MRNPAFFRKSCGFTLLEMVLAIAVLSTLSAAGYAGFLQFNKSKDLSLTTADFVNVLNEAKTDTQTQVGATNCGVSNTFIGYQVAIDNSASPKTYKLQRVCTNGATDVKTRIIPTSLSLNLNIITYGANNITISTPASTLLFQVPGGTLTSSYAATITGNSVKGVGIDQNGVILQCGTNCSN